MSLYNRSDEQSLDHLERWRAIAMRFDAFETYRVELHNSDRTVYEVTAKNIDAAHRIAEQRHLKRLFTHSRFEYGATITRIER